jgi:hypothetical protein
VGPKPMPSAPSTNDAAKPPKPTRNKSPILTNPKIPTGLAYKIPSLSCACWRITLQHRRDQADTAFFPARMAQKAIQRMPVDWPALVSSPKSAAAQVIQVPAITATSASGSNRMRGGGLKVAKANCRSPQQGQTAKEKRSLF